MPICAAGHDSTATDYCDVCGLAFGGASSAPAAAGPAPSPTVSAPLPEAPGEPCPNCSTPRAADERFCEVCGLDFTTGAMPAAPAAQPAVSPAPSSAVPGPAGPPTGWSVVITADPEWFADNAGGSADGIELPDPLPAPRTEPLMATTSIGRAGSSTRPDIAIDDDAVSRKHCELRQTVAGSWVVEDLGSTNGTYLDDATDPITPHTDTPLASGTRIKLGAYTILTLTQ